MTSPCIGVYVRPPAPNIVDDLIGGFTWSPAYHASVIDYDGDKSEWQALPRYGVGRVDHWGTHHPKGAVIELYDFVDPLTEDEVVEGQAFLQGEKGCGYDYLGLAGFLARHHFRESNTRWFCSELAFAWAQASGRVLLNNVEPYQVSPGMIRQSTIIRPRGRIIVGDGERIYPMSVANTRPTVTRNALGDLGGVLRPA